jgi:uncharacterized protein YebE (UPF0316 family)
MELFGSETFTYIVLPALIFLARVCDVSIGTMRIILVSRGAKIIAPLLGFFEILVWLVAIGKVMENLTNVACYVAYAGGFAAGNLVGIYIEEKVAMGTVLIRIITPKGASELIKNLRGEGFGATSIPAEGSTGRVFVIYSLIKRSDLDYVVAIIKKFNPKAFYSIEDVRFVSQGGLPLNKSGQMGNAFGFGRLFRARKGK